MPALPERCWAGFLLAFFRRRDWKLRTNVVFAMNDIFVLCFTKKWIHSKALQSYLSSFPIRNLLITFKNSKNFVHLIKFFQWQCFKGRNINYKSNYMQLKLKNSTWWLWLAFYSTVLYFKNSVSSGLTGRSFSSSMTLLTRYCKCFFRLIKKYNIRLIHI